MSDENRMTPKPLRSQVFRSFADLRVRPKVMVLHNGFFLALSLAVYFSVIPLVSKGLDTAKAREVSLLFQTLRTLSTDPASESLLKPYDLTTGTAADFGLSPDAIAWLTGNPGQVWRRGADGEFLYAAVPGSERYYRLTLPVGFYDFVLESVKFALFVVLGIGYVFAVVLLEVFIMPRYVYRRLQVMLAADAATREGDREGELIAAGEIPGDEVGEIMASRNETIRALRWYEDGLLKKNEELEAAKRNLEAQDRLVSLGLLSASVAHEMNTPLAVLEGSIERLQETVDSPAAQQRLARMARVAARLRKISAGLLDFARARKPGMKELELRPLLEEAWQLVGIDERAAGVELHMNIPDSIRVHGNSDRLVQVWVNLLRNALEVVPFPGGCIQVNARPHTLGGKPAVAVSVEDNGPGIPAEVLPEIFEAFVTTRLDARGTGLGLAVSEGIVHQHGGEISASNCPSGGARLEVILPAP